MKIKDLYGHEIEIKDWEQSLKQVDEMLQPVIEKSPFESDFLRVQKMIGRIFLINFWS